MLLRALFAFLVLPGVVAFAVPAALAWRSGDLAIVHPAGLALVGLGSAGLLWCVRDFYVSGNGTLAPWAPPAHLVVVGLYRYSRNPMYVAVVVILAGWAATVSSTGLLAYALAVALAFQLRVVWAEEPWLAHRHGRAWDAYAARVRRWL